jgi:hypothetical protein
LRIGSIDDGVEENGDLGWDKWVLRDEGKAEDCSSLGNTLDDQRAFRNKPLNGRKKSSRMKVWNTQQESRDWNFSASRFHILLAITCVRALYHRRWRYQFPYDLATSTASSSSKSSLCPLTQHGKMISYQPAEGFENDRLWERQTDKVSVHQNVIKSKY